MHASASTDELCPDKVLTQAADQVQRGFGLPVEGDMTDHNLWNGLCLYCGKELGDILRFANHRYLTSFEHFSEAIQKKAPLAQDDGPANRGKPGRG